MLALPVQSLALTMQTHAAERLSLQALLAGLVPCRQAFRGLCRCKSQRRWLLKLCDSVQLQ